MGKVWEGVICIVKSGPDASRKFPGFIQRYLFGPHPETLKHDMQLQGCIRHAEARSAFCSVSAGELLLGLHVQAILPSDTIVLKAI